MSLFNDNGKNKSEEMLDFGFEADFTESEYTTISGKEQRNLADATGYGIFDLDVGNIVTGYPEISIFENNEKNDAGEFIRKYQGIRLRVIDVDEYVDLYANIPRRNENGFIENINKYQNFYRTGFDLIFSFMRWLDESLVITTDGNEINRISRVNIDAICKKMDSMDFIKIKIIEGADADYNSFILMDMKETI